MINNTGKKCWLTTLMANKCISQKIVHQSKPNLELTGASLYYNNVTDVKIKLDQSPRVIHEHVVDVSQSKDNWEVTWNLSLEVDPYHITEPGRYISTVTYTFVTCRIYYKN